MKKNNTITIVLAVICCISLIVSVISLSYATNQNKQISQLENDCHSYDDRQYIDSQLESIQEEIDLSEYNYPIGDLENETVWMNYGVRQAWTATTKDRVCIQSGKYFTVVYAYNMTIPDNNDDPSQDRYYEFIDSTNPGYLIVSGVETGFAIIGITKK